ncbi:ferritin, partial [candidate division TA06 bacterium]
LINDLVNLAIAEKDHATNSFLQWFVSEQVEEESSANAVLGKVKLVGKSGDGLLMTDRELAQRVFTPPATGKGGEK